MRTNAHLETGGKMAGRAGTLNFIDDLAMEQGATFDGTLAFTNDDATAVNLTGYSIVWQVRDDNNDALILDLSIYCTIATPSNGIVSFNVPRTITEDLTPGNYWTDFLLTQGTYGRFEFRGSFQIIDTISQA